MHFIKKTTSSHNKIRVSNVRHTHNRFTDQKTGKRYRIIIKMSLLKYKLDESFYEFEIVNDDFTKLIPDETHIFDMKLQTFQMLYNAL